LSYFGIDEIPVSHFTETEKCRKEIFKLLKMVLCSSCDGGPLKFKKKNGLASSLPAWNI
jgi:hypothetical protein